MQNVRLFSGRADSDPVRLRTDGGCEKTDQCNYDKKDTHRDADLVGRRAR